MARYTVHPVSDENCDSLDTTTVVATTDDLAEAKQTASHGPAAFGYGIRDSVTGAIDVGFGFGVACPAIEE